MFISVHRTADLSLTTPLVCCCNCGEPGPIDLAETPLRKTRYFLFAGSELTLSESFPYCAACNASAARVCPGWFSQVAATALVASVLFLVMIFAAPHLPGFLANNLFVASALLALVGTMAYFQFRQRATQARSYYQPVSLVDATLEGNDVQQVSLRFFNAEYAALFAQANEALIRAGAVRVVV
jgi:hypothetical protein